MLLNLSTVIKSNSSIITKINMELITGHSCKLIGDKIEQFDYNIKMLGLITSDGHGSVILLVISSNSWAEQMIGIVLLVNKKLHMIFI